MFNVLLGVVLLVASALAQEKKLDNGFVLVTTTHADGTSSGQLFDDEGRKLEPAFGFFYDRRTTLMYDPTGKPTGFSFEPARLVFKNVSLDGILFADRIDLISPPTAFATESTREKVIGLLKQWAPQFTYTPVWGEYQNGSWVREPQQERHIIVSMGNVKYGRLNAGLLANTIMRQGSLEGARQLIVAELNAMRPLANQ
jgi:hypothetical protein